MTFSRKIFLSVFLTTLILGSGLIWTSHRYITQQTEEKFISRYSVFTKMLADTLNRMDLSTEALMLNAAKVVAAKDKEQGVLSDQALKALRDDLKMTHVFVTNKNGKFIRSTNEDASLIPNLFSFCGDYKKLVAGTSLVEATPVIKPNPEPKPFKFLSIPSYDKTRIIEVGVRVDFIAKTLAEAISTDKNVMSMALYGPDGTSFGRFNASHVEFSEEMIRLPDNLNSIEQTKNNFQFYSKVESSHKKCCQCDVAGTSKNGEYYYVLEAQVSKDELNAIQAATTRNFLILGFINLIMSLLLSRFLSRRLVKNIEKAANKVKEIGFHGDLKDRINHKGKDEVAFLTGEFDRLLDKLEESQEKIIESEKIEAKVQLAKEVAHNIKSPIHAIEMMIPTMVNVSDNTRKILSDSVKDIKTLSQRLKAQADSLSIDKGVATIDSETLYLPYVLNEIACQKQVEYSARTEIKFEFRDESQCKDAFVTGCSTEFKSILSNLINNAVESYGPHGGSIDIKLTCDFSSCAVFVTDSGIGIPGDFLLDLGKKPISFKGNKSRGLGLTHAYKILTSWGGNIKIDSQVGRGTTVEITLPKLYNADKRKLDRAKYLER